MLGVYARRGSLIEALELAVLPAALGVELVGWHGLHRWAPLLVLFRFWRLSPLISHHQWKPLATVPVAPPSRVGVVKLDPSFVAGVTSRAAQQEKHLHELRERAEAGFRKVERVVGGVASVREVAVPAEGLVHQVDAATLETMSQALVAEHAAHATDLRTLASLEAQLARVGEEQDSRCVALQAALDAEAAKAVALKHQLETLRITLQRQEYTKRALSSHASSGSPESSRAQILI
eukprot:CAMPEP_0175947274 /NCGR_PEP_ID=MMETSP0108-20121206/27792_1 /TAXON_ID=195067 ORGANISM="Goniomonas pacifica, Strain CCMP1869" /NCGR_SAMPLE_ID=MMETSP0108 /ASSEMBLY_ACC=CAM_ASM_000204 /LENGTH=234 /DNA_ID=CAMNT_0017272881 /DNA_START=6 /DNA_END=710 /DNA_ORIENTATION=+